MTVTRGKQNRICSFGDVSPLNFCLLLYFQTHDASFYGVLDSF